MTDDKITKEELFKYIGKNRFDTEQEFKDFIKPKIKDILAIPKDRIGEEPGDTASDDNRFDIYIYDKETLSEILILIGLKVSRKYPQLTGDDIEKFNSFCMDKKVMYSALLNEAECHFFRYRKTEASVDIVEIDEIPPLNHIDYESEKEISPKKVIDFLKSRKIFIATVIVVLLVILLLKMTAGVFCASGGSIKGDIKDGKKIYYLPDASGYAGIEIGDQKGERRFCTEQDAIDNGFVNSQKAK